MQTLQANKVILGDLVEQFGLARTFDLQFPQEWQGVVEVSSVEIQQLEQVQIRFNYLLENAPLLKDVVKRVVLALLTELAGFYRSLVQIQNKTGVEISSPDLRSGVLVCGKIDVLVVFSRWWFLGRFGK